MKIKVNSLCELTAIYKGKTKTLGEIFSRIKMQTLTLLLVHEEFVLIDTKISVLKSAATHWFFKIVDYLFYLTLATGLLI